MELVDDDHVYCCELFNKAKKIYNYFFHVIFLETCRSYGTFPEGLKINKQPFIKFESETQSTEWNTCIRSTEIDLCKMLEVGLVKNMYALEEDFWKGIETLKNSSSDWWTRVLVYLTKYERKLVKKNKQKIKKLLGKDNERLELALNRYEEHLMHFDFKKEMNLYSTKTFSDISNVVTLITLNNSSSSEDSLGNTSRIFEDYVAVESSDMFENVIETSNNSATLTDGRFVGKFVSSNVVDISSRILSDAEISLLSKGLKFVPTEHQANVAQLKEDLERFGRNLRLMWHFRDEEEEFSYNPFRPKSKFNPKGNDAAIEIYLSRLEEEILAIDTNIQYSNLTRDERKALNTLKGDTSIIIKEADKGSAVVVWDREDYLKEAESQLSDNNIYEKVQGDPIPSLVNLVQYHLSNVKARGDTSSETLDYFMVNNPKLGRFYLLPKIHKRLNAIPGRPVISNCGYFTENISSFLDYHLQPLTKSVKSFIKDTNDFLRKLRSLPLLPDNSLLCTIDVVGLYPNIPHEEGLIAIRKALDKREDKVITTDSLMELAECVLKNNIFEHNTCVYKQKQGTAIGTKMAPPYAILFMAELEENILKSAILKPLVWWRYIDDIFMI